MRCVWLGISIGWAGAAEAAPWVRDEGGWYARALVAQDTLEGETGWRRDAYGEYGLSPRWTLTAKAETIQFPDAASFDRDSYRLTLRRSLIERGGWVAGAEGGFVHGSTVSGIVGCEGSGLEGRAGLGYSGTRRGRNFHAFADVALIGHQDGCRRQRAEIGFGSDLTDRIFTGQQIWFETGNETASSVKTETQLGIHFDTFDLAIGYRDEIGGRFRESAVLIALVARR